MIRSCADEEDKVIIDKAFRKLLKDKAKQVKGAAFKSVGKYIIYRRSNHPSFLVKAYTKLMDAQENSELVYCCAYYFTGVVLTLGEDSWEKLKKYYYRLLTQELKIKLSLLSSMPYLSEIIGPDLTERDLFEEYLTLLNSEETREKATTILTRILKNLTTPESKENCILQIKEIVTSGNWRIRQSLASQLSEFCEIYEESFLFTEIWPLCLELLNDRFHSVRIESAQSMGKICVFLYEKCGSNFNEMEPVLRELSTSSNYQKRLLFIETCAAMLSNIGLVTDKLKMYILKISTDQVANNRLKLAKLVKRALLRENSALFLELREILKKDRDPEVSALCAEEVEMAVGLLLGPVLRDTVPSFPSECWEFSFPQGESTHFSYLPPFSELES